MSENQIKNSGNFLKINNSVARKYISAIILGLNDALIEMTGALAGFTMVLPNNRTIVLAGLTTGIAATLSMAASEYLAEEANYSSLNPILAASITGSSYFITIVLLLIPFIVFDTPLVSLPLCILLAGILIFLFTFFESFLRNQSFKKLCLKMLFISFGVAILSFCISWLADLYWGIPV